MKQAYHKRSDGCFNQYREVELTGLCKKVTGGSIRKQERHYYQAQYRVFGIPIYKYWIDQDEVYFIDPIEESYYYSTTVTPTKSPSEGSEGSEAQEDILALEQRVTRLKNALIEVVDSINWYTDWYKYDDSSLVKRASVIAETAIDEDNQKMYGKEDRGYERPV